MMKAVRSFILSLLMLQLAFPFHVFADSVGEFTQLKGSVSQERDNKYLTPGVGGDVNIKDLISTEIKARAKIKLVDDSLLTIGQNSRVEITEFLIEDKQRKGVLSLSSGKAFTNVKKFLNPGSSFEVHTPTAVAAARGTAWISIVENNPGSTFYALEDSIIVFNPAFPDKIVTLNAGQYTVVTANAAPTAPAAYAITAIQGILEELGITAEFGAAEAAAATTEGISTATGLGIAAGLAAVVTGVVIATDDDDDDDHRDGAPAPGPTPPPSGGLSDVTVNQKNINLTVWDDATVDGDQIDLIVNGMTVLNDHVLVGPPGTIVSVTLNVGSNPLRVHADNEGTLTTNTAALIISNVVIGNANQSWDLSTGEDANMTIFVDEGATAPPPTTPPPTPYFQASMLDLN